MNEVYEYLARIEEYGDLVAFTDGKNECTYGEIVTQGKEILAELLEERVNPGAKVAVIGDFSSTTISLLFALFINSNIVIPISAHSKIEIVELVKVSGCDWIINCTNGDGYTIEKFVYLNEYSETFYRELHNGSSSGLVLFSSGTSGKPKGIVHDLNRVLKRFKNPGKRYVTIPLLMFDHFGGYNTIFGLLSSGSKIVRITERSVDSVASAIENFKVTLLPTTPSFLALFLAAKLNVKYDLSSLEKISYGTEVMPQSLLEKLHKTFPNVKFQQTYGLSELGVLNSKSKSDNSTWVKLGGEGYALKVENGELWIKSEYSMLGYISENSALPSSGWFNTHDQVEVDGDFVRILGRDSDLINIGGQKVFPQEIEDVLLLHKNVTSVRVTGERHNLLGQIACAEVSLSEGADVSKGELRAFCKKHLASFKVPQQIRIVESIPLTHRMKKGKS
jgi:acyl-CoA synthetase (AMP-forming)/AMP-acid ligase II